MIKKYNCVNYINCTKAQNDEIIELNIGADENCPECNSKLEPKLEKKKNLTIPFLITGLSILIIGYFLFNFFKSSLISAEEDKIIEIDLPSTPIDEIKSNLNEENSNEIILNKNQVELELNEIADKNTESKIRLGKINGFLNWFSNDAEVRILGNESGSTLEIIPVKEYLDRIAYFKTIESIQVFENL
jgi:hypothetical protein